jgi:integrase
VWCFSFPPPPPPASLSPVPTNGDPVWIEQHKTKYRIRDLVNGKKVTIESGIPTKTMARERKKRLEIEQADHGPLKVGAGKVVFKDWAESWWKSHSRTVAPGTVKSEGSRFRRHIIGRLGHLPIGQIDAAVVRWWIEQLAEPDDAEYDPIGPKSIKNVHGYLFMAMETAVHERIIRSNPCGVSKLPVWNPRQPRFLSQKELGRVLALIPLESRPLAVVLAGTGCRAGEALGLKWRHVDVLGGKIRFETQMRIVNGQPVDAPLKTKASRRTVGVGPSVCRVLAELVDVDPNAWVFKNRFGEPMRYETFRKVWFRALNGDGTPARPPTEFAGLHVHDLRHTHAAHLIAARRPLTSIQRRLGHSSIRVTSDIYGGLLPEVEEDTAAAAEAALSEVDLSGIGGGIVGEQARSEPLGTAYNRSQDKGKPQVSR